MTSFLDSLSRYFQRFATDAYNPLVIVAELLLIGAVVYALLRFLEGTRGASVLQGVVLLVVVGFLVIRVLADALGLVRIQVLFQYFVWAVFLTALVVFQPELRRGLVRLGERRWLRRWLRTSESIVEPIVEAVERLSRQKIGALIAITREVGLTGMAERGIPIDGRVSRELLESIFIPRSPLHDLGVIIQDDRIIAASCPFPVSEAEPTDRTLGSRHRAGLGLSEDSDALIIIVSEETGTISLAEAGQLTRGLTADQLRDRLHLELRRTAIAIRTRGRKAT